jgi:prepilin-type processing-associated H-X9-DG protein
VKPKVRHNGLNYLFFDGHVSREPRPPHSMGAQFGTFLTSDGTGFTITTEEETAFLHRLGSLNAP